jgi:DNA-binding GntR family transcriptional regulator
MKPQADRYARLYSRSLTDRLDLSTALAEHETIIRAVEAGDSDAAQQAIRSNWRNGAHRIAALIEQWGESGGW